MVTWRAVVPTTARSEYVSADGRWTLRQEFDAWYLADAEVPGHGRFFRKRGAEHHIEDVLAAEARR